MLRNESGQTTIEYILIVAVIVGIYGLFMKNPKIKEYMSGGKIIEELATHIQFCYRHALPGTEKEKYPAFYQAPTHKSYLEGPRETRFFGPKTGYP